MSNKEKSVQQRKEPFPWLLLSYGVLNVALVCFIFYGGYHFLEPIGWHSYLESIFPKIFNAWDRHKLDQAYSITYAWLFLIALLPLPYFLWFLVNNTHKFKASEDKLREFFKVLIGLIFSSIIIFTFLNKTSPTAKLSFLFHETHFLGLTLVSLIMTSFMFMFMFSVFLMTRMVLNKICIGRN